MGRKKKDARGKVVVIILLRGARNSYVRGNRMKTFTVTGRKVTEVAKAILRPIEKLRRRS